MGRYQQVANPGNPPVAPNVGGPVAIGPEAVCIFGHTLDRVLVYNRALGVIVHIMGCIHSHLISPWLSEVFLDEVFEGQ
ncbi:hypothetical protein Pa222_020 [Pseudomonas virus Pa222]|nr:hypothetical protein Pa222_020 [Pseudomonas virus Pa222]